MDIYDKKEQFMAANPSVSEASVDDLIKTVVANCMQCIVENDEVVGDGAKAWWTLKDSYGIEIEGAHQLPVANRENTAQDEAILSQACYEGDLDTIKSCLKKNMNVYEAFTRLASYGQLEVLKFFMEDECVTRHPRYRNDLNPLYCKGILFENAYYSEQAEILQYLIFQHEAHFSPEAKRVLKQNTPEHMKDFKREVVQMIEKHYVNTMLELSLDNSPHNKTKPKL